MNPKATVYTLPDLAVFDVSGADAVSFIQGQITNDIAGAAPHTACLAGYCTPQGRLLATMVLHQVKPSGDATTNLVGIIKRDILPTVLKRLSMFVMRAKAKLSESASVVRGVTVNQDELDRFASFMDCQLPTVVWEKADSSAGTWICAPSSGMHRWWLISNEEQNTTAEALLTQHATGDVQVWYAMDIAEGLPWVEAATQDMFIPQTLNLDLIQGVSFTKGCYPGQEIVARSHYRGTLKRRMIHASVSHEANQLNANQLIPGIDIYDASRDDQVCGRIINVAKTEQTAQLLIEASFEAVDHGQLRAVSAKGPELTIQKLPYPVRPSAENK